MFQKIIDLLYRKPKSKFNYYRKFGGYFNIKKIEKARQKMESSAFFLSPVISFNHGLPIYFLTGKKYLYQTLFCIQSLVKTTEEKFNFYLIDDGSFTKDDKEKINQLLPNCTVYYKETIDKQLSIKLPKEHFPYLHYKRKIYPHIKKLTDIHIFEENQWKLVLDSDMIFWKQPNEIINWLKNPLTPIHMLDCEESYGYTRKIMRELSGNEIKPLVNVGAIGLSSSSIDWQKLENWCTILEKREGTTYYLEQALSAMLIGDQHAVSLDKTYYITNPKQINPKHILHHYVDTSKELYFKEAWEKIARQN